MDILTAFNNGFAAKVAKGFDLAAFHGINPRTGGASTVVGTNHFDSKVTQKVEYTKGTPDTNLDAAIAMVQGSDGDVTGIALSNAFGADMATVTVRYGSEHWLFCQVIAAGGAIRILDDPAQALRLCDMAKSLTCPL